MKGHGAKFPRKKQEAIGALLTEPTMGKAAKKAGVGEVTLWRWFQNPEFQEAYRAAKRRVVEHAIGRLQKATAVAVDALIEVVGDAQTPPSTKVSAARVILEAAIRAVELEDLSARIAVLEEEVAQRRE